VKKESNNSNYQIIKRIINGNFPTFSILILWFHQYPVHFIMSYNSFARSGSRLFNIKNNNTQKNK